MIDYSSARRTLIAVSALGSALLLAPWSAHAEPGRPGKDVPLLQKDLKSGPNEGLMLSVELPPGAAAPVHRHRASVFVYMLEGEVVMQVKGGPEVNLKPGEVFYESPQDIHVQTRNTSTTAPARFLVFMVKKKGAPPVEPVH